MVSQLSESAVDDLETTADAAAEGASAAMSEEAKATKKVERERHTIFIGNLDFGKSKGGGYLEEAFAGRFL